MPVELNHTIVAARDKHASATWLAELLGLDVGAQYGPFVPVTTHNGVDLDYADAGTGEITSQHYAFLVAEDEFDAILVRIRDAGITHYAGPGPQGPGKINTEDGGRGTYFLDPDGHVMEILTRPYGGGGR